MKAILLTLFSFLTITFLYAVQLPNSDFSQWTDDRGFDEPIAWENSDFYIHAFTPNGPFGVNKSTMANQGDYSVQLVTFNRTDIDGAEGNYPAFIQKGMSVSQKPHVLRGSVQTNLLPGDSAAVGISAYKNNVLIGEGAALFGGTTQSFAPFEAVISYTEEGTPDSIVVVAISTIYNQFTEGEIHIDYVSLDYTAVSARDIASKNLQKRVVRAGPNPVTNRFFILVETDRTTSFEINLYDVLGTRVYQQTIPQVERGNKEISIDIPNHLSNGMYIFEVKSADFRHTNRISIRR
ncbi:MAG: T9SS C-terminal target domain-containing protein [Chitinophagaceae bacterium]|nr:MAG: T9SS C-terminal target domain-containing protein [Chitinophagaceae bacterium]